MNLIPLTVLQQNGTALVRPKVLAFIDTKISEINATVDGLKILYDNIEFVIAETLAEFRCALNDADTSILTNAASLVDAAFLPAGTAQATAQAITTQYLIQATGGTVDTADGVALPDAVVGAKVVIVNAEAFELQVFPKDGSGDTIDGGVADTEVGQAPATRKHYVCLVAGAWVTATDNT